MSLAPILVTVYNRDKHFIKCIESLKKCTLADKSHLFIAIDAPSREEDIKSNNIILNYANKIKGFKELTLFTRPENFGAKKNRKIARDAIFSNYDRFIDSEDDNIFSSSFLHFINKGLDLYNDREDVFSISGYNYPITIPDNYDKQIYAWAGMSAYGVGLWRDKYNKLNLSNHVVKEWLDDKEHLKNLDKVAQHYRFALKAMHKNNRIDGDGFISSYLVENNMYSIFPVKTLVRNIGNDGFGNNKFLSRKFLKQEVYNGQIKELEYDIKPNKEINKVLWRYFSNVNRLKNRIEHLIIKYTM